ncbi:hypothetical protein H6G89_33195 [Oscillatoria sp. FACHB-1407]|nr:hypothetical protein [Oscillatoria sp. FACHB-1407]MBD2465847.1 hypothetical protein [Oscillatoria sp. FACHB-1407]
MTFTNPQPQQRLFQSESVISQQTSKKRLTAQWIVVDGKLVCKWIIA